MRMMSRLLLSVMILAAAASSPALSAAEDWRKLEAANGAVIAYDANSIAHHIGGGAEISVYAVEGETFNPRNLRRLVFDCQGHFFDTSAMDRIEYAPPLSVVGRIGEIACADARDRREELYGE